MKARGLIIAVFLLFAGFIAWRTLLRGGTTSDQPALSAESSPSANAAPGARAAPADNPALAATAGAKTNAGSPLQGARAPVEIVFEYGTEKREWIEAAVADFSKIRSEVKVTLLGKGSLDAAQAIVEGLDKPTIFSPADSLVLKLLDTDWQTKNRTSILGQGDDAPEPLVITPLVFAIWEDRANALLKTAGGKVTWKALHGAIASNRGWPAVGGKAEWGFVKLGHTDPTRSNSGLQTLLLMTSEFFGKTSALTVGDLLKPEYQAYVAAIERGVPKFEASTGTFMTDMVRFGPSKYDIALVYESLVVAQIENAQGRWGNLKVYYPETTFWSDHPAALLQGEWVTDAQREAARAFLAFLRSRPMQERAVAYGFRPADPAVPLRTATLDPYARLAPFGVRVEIPPAATPPEGAVIRNLITMWSRVVARH